MIYSPHLWIYMDIVFGQLHLMMLGTKLEAVPADTVSFELCIYSYLRASCVHSDRVCRSYSFIINVLLLIECRWSHSIQILLHVRNNNHSKTQPRDNHLAGKRWVLGKSIGCTERRLELVDAMFFLPEAYECC